MKMQIREFMGDYALDLDYPDEKIVIYFNSYQNALNVKRIIEVDGSVPNVATVADFVEVVRCKDCKSCDKFYPNKKIGEEPELEYFCKIGKHTTRADDFCSLGERRALE